MGTIKQSDLCSFMLSYCPYVKRENFFWSDEVPVGYNAPNNKFIEKLPITYRTIDKYNMVTDYRGSINDSKILFNYLEYKQYQKISMAIYRPSGLLDSFTFGNINAELSKSPWIYIRYKFEKSTNDIWEVNILSAESVHGNNKWEF